MGKLGQEAEKLIEGITNFVLALAKIAAIIALVLLGGFMVLVIIKEIRMRSWRKKAQGLPDCKPPVNLGDGDGEDDGEGDDEK